jgi:hypothetical protein
MLVLTENSIYAFKTHKNTLWIHIETRCNSRTRTSIIVRLMIAQYKAETCCVNSENKTNVDTIVSILFFRNIVVT